MKATISANGGASATGAMLVNAPAHADPQWPAAEASAPQSRLARPLSTRTGARPVKLAVKSAGSDTL